MKHLLNPAAFVLIVIISLLSVGGFLGNAYWSLAWYSNPRPHFAAVSLITVVWFAWQRLSAIFILSFA